MYIRQPLAIRLPVAIYGTRRRCAATLNISGIFRKHMTLEHGGVGFEYGMVSLGLHCFLRLERALCWRSGRCLAGVVTKD